MDGVVEWASKSKGGEWATEVLIQTSSKYKVFWQPCMSSACASVHVNAPMRVNDDEDDDGKVIMQPKHSITSLWLD